MDLRRLSAGAACLFSILGLAAACGQASPGTADDSEEEAYRRKKDSGKTGEIQLLVTVDWEGRDLTAANLDAMEALRARFPNLKITQFVNAAYFTKPGASAADVQAKMERALRPADERGLHIHGWKRLFQAAGVTFRATPTFWGGANQLSNDCAFDCGHEVPISAYTTSELRKVVKFSLDTLETNGFGRATSFRAGGWMAKSNVRDALSAEGIRFENSAVPAIELTKLDGLPLHDWLGTLWTGTTSTSQPYTLPTASTDLVEIPDNGALSDYMSAQQMVDVYEACKATYLKDRSHNVVVSIGFHQETAATYLPVFEDALDQILALAKAEKIPLESVTSASIVPR